MSGGHGTMEIEAITSGGRRDPGDSERGASLVLVLSLMLLLTFLATSLLFTTDVEFKAGKAFSDDASTLADADNAVAEVLWRLNLTQAAGAPPAGSRISVNSLSNFDAKLNPDPFGLMTNEIDDDGNGVADDPTELNFMREWKVYLLLRPDETHPGSPYEISDTDALAGPPWGPTLVTPTVQPQASWRLYSTALPGSVDVLTLRYKLDTDLPTPDPDGDGPEPVFYDMRLATNGKDDKNCTNNLGGDGNRNNDSPYNITYFDGTTTHYASGSPVLLLSGVSRLERGGREVARRKFEVEIIYPVRPVYTKALCACGDFGGHGNPSTDSYRSSEGEYGIGTIYQNGDIGANGNMEVDGTISGKAEAGGWINGGENVYGDNTAGGTITGTPTGPGSLNFANQFPPPQPCECGAIDVATLVASKTGLPKAADADCYKNATSYQMQLTGGATCTLTAGEYYFSSIDIAGGAYLEIDASLGPVIIYTDGDATFNGNGVTNNGRPEDFRFISSGLDLKLTGTADLRGVFLAPLADAVLTGNADTQGAVLAKTVDFGGTNDVHFDEDLADLWSVNGTYKVLNWKEIE